MMLTIETLFNDPNIVGAIINRVNQTRKDAIYWQQYLDFRRTTTRVFKDYIGSVQGVMAGSINSQFGEKPIRERRSIGNGYGEVAYLGDAYQMSVDRLSDLKDLIDLYNTARSQDQNDAIQEIINFLYDDYRQVLLAAHKRMDLVVGSLLMKGSAIVKNKDAAVSEQDAAEFLNIELPFNTLTPETSDVVVDSKMYFITYLQTTIQKLIPDYGRYQKMIMSRGTFVKYIIGSAEFNDKFKMVLGNNSFYLNPGLITSEMASNVFTGLGLPAIEIKEDYVKNQQGVNTAVYEDGYITFLPQDKIGYMRHHEPYEGTDPVPGRNYVAGGDGQLLISNYRDKEGRYMEYTAEWIPQISNPNLITNIDLVNLSEEG